MRQTGGKEQLLQKHRGRYNVNDEQRKGIIGDTVEIIGWNQIVENNAGYIIFFYFILSYSVSSEKSIILLRTFGLSSSFVTHQLGNLSNMSVPIFSNTTSLG